MRNIIQGAIVALVCVVAIPPLVGAAAGQLTAGPDIAGLTLQLRTVNARVTVTQDRLRALTAQLKSRATTKSLNAVKKSASGAAAAAAAANAAAVAAKASGDGAAAGVAELRTSIAAIPRGPKAWVAVDGLTEGVARIIASSGNVTVREVGVNGTSRAFCLSVPGIGPLTNPASVSLLESGGVVGGASAFSGPGFSTTCNGPNEYWIGIEDTQSGVFGQYNAAFFFLVP